jgi:hypothetical protein
MHGRSGVNVTARRGDDASARRCRSKARRERVPFSRSATWTCAAPLPSMINRGSDVMINRHPTPAPKICPGSGGGATFLGPVDARAGFANLCTGGFSGLEGRLMMLSLGGV